MSGNGRGFGRVVGVDDGLDAARGHERARVHVARTRAAERSREAQVPLAVEEGLANARLLLQRAREDGVRGERDADRVDEAARVRDPEAEAAEARELALLLVDEEERAAHEERRREAQHEQRDLFVEARLVELTEQRLERLEAAHVLVEDAPAVGAPLAGGLAELDAQLAREIEARGDERRSAQALEHRVQVRRERGLVAGRGRRGLAARLVHDARAAELAQHVLGVGVRALDGEEARDRRDRGRRRASRSRGRRGCPCPWCAA